MRLPRLKIPLLVSAGVVVLGCALLWLYNNVSLFPPSLATFQRRHEEALSRGRDWILGKGGQSPETDRARQHDLVSNTALIHMLVSCAAMARDPDVRWSADQYLRLARDPGWWGRMVEPSVAPVTPPQEYLDRLVFYQRWFIHAMSAGQYLLTPEERERLFSPTRNSTGVLTHQLFALYLLETLEGSTPERRRLVDRLAPRIAFEASLDFRVTDLYVQRVAFLLAVGRPDLVERRWVERILDAQEPDGGWRYSWHGWDPILLRVRPFERRRSDAHAAAQAVWILYMLKYRYPDWAGRHYRSVF